MVYFGMHLIKMVSVYSVVDMMKDNSDNLYDEDLVRQDVNENPEMIRAISNHLKMCAECRKAQQDACYKVWNHLLDTGSAPKKNKDGKYA